MEVDTLSCARPRETLVETQHDPDDNFPCARPTEQDDESFSVITWTLELEYLGSTHQMDRVQRNCNETLYWLNLKKSALECNLVEGICVRTWTRRDPEIWLGMTTSRKTSVDARSVTLKSVLGAYSQLPLTPMNSLRTLSRHSLHQRLSFKLCTLLEI